MTKQPQRPPGMALVDNTLPPTEKARIISELRSEFRLDDLLEVAGMARSTYYYQCKVLAAPDRYADLKVRIKAIHEASAGRYGYRRVTEAVRAEGYLVDGKTVRKLMFALGLEGRPG